MVLLPSKQELEQLAAVRGPYCISIYAPFVQPNAADNPNRIVVKNLLRKAAEVMLQSGADDASISATLDPAYALLESAEFWPAQHDAVALLLRPHEMHYYRLPPDNVGQLLSVADHFDLGQLYSCMADNSEYYLMALSHNQAQAYRGDRDRLKPLVLKDIASMEETLHIDEYPKIRALHGDGASGEGGKAASSLHKPFDVAGIDKQMLLEYFRIVDKRLHDYVAKSRHPLLLAGVAYLLPLYRQVNTYDWLLTPSIRGNAEHIPASELRARAWQIIRNRPETETTTPARQRA